MHSDLPNDQPPHCSSRACCDHFFALSCALDVAQCCNTYAQVCDSTRISTLLKLKLRSCTASHPWQQKHGMHASAKGSILLYSIDNWNYAIAATSYNVMLFGRGRACAFEESNYCGVPDEEMVVEIPTSQRHDHTFDTHIWRRACRKVLVLVTVNKWCIDLKGSLTTSSVGVI